MPITAPFGPYSPDLVGFVRDFGAGSGYYDANGHYARVAPLFNDFSLGANNTLTPVTPQQGLQGLQDRSAAPLPGRGDAAAPADGSSPFTDGGAARLRPIGDAVMNPRRRNSLAGSPLLIGAITTLIVVVAVFLSYNANNGLPFVPTYNLKVELPETSGLQPTNQVRIAGTRVGVVSSLVPHQNPATGRVTAIADMKLEKKFEPLPADTKAIVQSVSAVGLKYLELEKGTSSQTLKPGATIPVSQSREPVDINQLFNMFDQKTRTAIQAEHDQLRRRPRRARAGAEQHDRRHCARWSPTRFPALHNLAAPQTGLRELFVALDRAGLADRPGGRRPTPTCSATWTRSSRPWASVAPSLERTIEGGPAALNRRSTRSPLRRRSWRRATEFMHLLRPSASCAAHLRPPLGHAFAVGAVNLRAATALNTELADRREGVPGIRPEPDRHARPGRTDTDDDARESAARGTHARAGHLQLPDARVPQRSEPPLGEHRRRHAGARAAGALVRLGPTPRASPSSGAGQRAIGRSRSRGSSSEAGKSVRDNDNHLHYNPYPNVAGPGQPKECEAGNQTYAVGQTVIGHVPGTLGTTTTKPRASRTSSAQNIRARR